MERTGETAHGRGFPEVKTPRRKVRVTTPRISNFQKEVGHEGSSEGDGQGERFGGWTGS